MTISHFATCSPNYPEKVEGEGPAEISEIDLGDGTTHRFCVDCGASENVPTASLSELRDHAQASIRHAWDDLKEELARVRRT